MLDLRITRNLNIRAVCACMVLLGLVLVLPGSAHGSARKKKAATAAEPVKREATWEDFDMSKFVFPLPPAVARIRLIDRYIGEKVERDVSKAKPKAKFLDRLAGEQPIMERKDVKVPYQLIAPYGMAIDSNGLVYAADQRVGAIFIFNPETKGTTLIRNGVEAHFGLINGLAIDDNNRLFVSDGKLNRVVVFNAKHKMEEYITDGMRHPVGLAIDTERRLLYVVDAELDQILVYDADTFKLTRKIGQTGHNHELTSPGNFSKPTFAAVDDDGNVYITDTMNDRVEIFDASGKFIRQFGKNCDAPGCFQRPKGIALDSDGHIWVADSMASRVQVFDSEGRLMIYFGSFGTLPTQFNSLVGIAIDKQNRVFTAEQQPGRIQIFRCITDAEAGAEKKRREEERTKNAGRPQAQSADPASSTKPAEIPAQK